MIKFDNSAPGGRGIISRGREIVNYEKYVLFTLISLYLEKRVWTYLNLFVVFCILSKNTDFD